jgi:hypothetical protein
MILSVEQVDRLRRSAAMAPLGSDAVTELLDACAQMAAERRQIAAVLARLPSSVAELRAALNELHGLVT